MPFITKNLFANKSIVLFGELIGVSYICLSLTHIFNHNSILLVIICMLESFLFGVGISVINTILRVQFMSCVDKNYLSRAGALFNAGGSGITPIMSWIIGITVTFICVSKIYLICGIICILFFILTKTFKMEFE